VLLGVGMGVPRCEAAVWITNVPVERRDPPAPEGIAADPAGPTADAVAAAAPIARSLAGGVLSTLRRVAPVADGEGSTLMLRLPPGDSDSSGRAG
jgi:hypothetical protein